MGGMDMGHGGSSAPRGLRPRGLRNRLARMASLVRDYATPWRVLMIGMVGAGLLVAVAVDQLILQLGGVALSVLAVVTLLAQLHHSLRVQGAVLGVDAPGRVAARRPIGRRIGRARPIVSVVIPARNEARHARDCIESLRVQTLENFEAIVVDDCSTDSTLDGVHDAIGQDPRFRIVRTDRSVGVGLARNLGVGVATEKYVTFLDPSDLLVPDSLASRVELAEQHADRPWVAGSYCRHEPIGSELPPATRQQGNVGHREAASWLEHDDDFFVASAPLVRRDAFLAVGGFDDACTAEGAVFWYRLLRWGFVLVGTGRVGIAYRQKPSSCAVSSAVDMRHAMSGLLAEQSAPSSPPDDQTGPFFFTDGFGRYQTAVEFTRWTATTLGIALAGGALDDVVDTLVGDLQSVPPPLVGWEVDVRALATSASRRISRRRDGLAREAPVAGQIERRLRPLIERAQRTASAWQDRPARPPLATGGAIARPVRKPTLLPVTPRSIRSFVRTGRPILLLPSAAYHTDELIELVEVLRERGLSPLAMLNKYRWRTTGTALSRVDVPAVEALPAGDWLLDFDAILTFNDWGKPYSEYVTYVAGRGPMSFGKVEGVQDWEDVDTNRTRNAYMASDVILCQGENDVKALEAKRSGLEVVGSARLEAIWHTPLPADAEPRVAGNVNFTYRVQSEHRDLWVHSLREACARANVPLDLSLHPSESVKYPTLAATEPIRHLMIHDSILVSRFSTVLFEGMARGCSVIYYNPHGERVPTFQHPEGAFDVAEDPDTLARLIHAAKARTRAQAKERAAAFFRRQVSMVPGTSVAIRTADVIERYIAPTPGLKNARRSERAKVAEKT